MPNMKKIAYKAKNLFKSKEQIELESRMKYKKQQREYTKYYNELGVSIKKFEKMAVEAENSGNHQNALSCAKFVLKLRNTQSRIQGLLQRFEMMYAMLQLSNRMSGFMETCAEMGLNMDASLDLSGMWKNMAIMESSLSKLDQMSELLNDAFDTIDQGLNNSDGEMFTEDEVNSDAQEFLNEAMGRVINSDPKAQPAKQEAVSGDSSELLNKMLQELKD